MFRLFRRSAKAPRFLLLPVTGTVGRRSGLVLGIGSKLHVHALRLAVAVHLDRHGISGRMAAHLQDNVRGARDLLVGDLRDDVTLLDTGLGGSARNSCLKASNSS